MKRNSLVVLILLLPLLPWIFQAGKFYYGLYADFSDLPVSHLPNAIYLLNSLKATGEIPLWSSLILGGTPFAADPLAGIWYPVGWIAYPFPQPMGFNLVLLLHIFWGGLGMTLLLNRLGLRREAAILGGLAFELMPKVFSHAAGGHITLVYAVAWIPWLLYGERIRQDKNARRLLTTLIPGVVIGLIFLADPRITVYAGLVWLMFSIWQLSGSRGTNPVGVSIMRGLGGSGYTLLIAFGIAAVLGLPMLEFVNNSTRSALAVKDILEFSLSPYQLFNLVFPSIGGFWESVIYPGAVLVLLLVYALAMRNVRRRTGFWLILIAVGLVISMGSLWPGSDIAARLPLVSLLRVPSRAWLLSGFGIAAVAAYSLDSILSPRQTSRKNSVTFVWIFLAGLSVFLPIGILGLSGSLPAGMIWSAIAFPLAAVILVQLRKSENQAGLTALLIALVVADLAGVNLLGMKFRGEPDVMGEGSAAAKFISSQPGQFRVYSPSYSIPQQTAAAYDLELADGVNPLQLRTTVDYMAQASGANQTGYSVTLPPYATGNPEVDNKTAVVDPYLLGLLNVRYLASAFPQNNTRLTGRWQENGTYIYENADFKPRVWVQDENAPPGESIRSLGTIETYTPNLITARVTGPGLLVFSEVDYPARILQVDGKPVEKLRIANLLMGAKIDSGEHEVKLTYQSSLLDLGLAISILTWLVVIGLAIFTPLKYKRLRTDASR